MESQGPTHSILPGNIISWKLFSGHKKRREISGKSNRTIPYNAMI